MLIKNLEDRLAEQREKDLFRKRVVVQKRQEKNNVIIDGKPCINFCSSDYLGLANDSEVTEAFSKAANQYGMGSGSSALIAGYHKPQQQLEEQFAAFLQRDRALFFNTGYLANLAVMSSFNNRENTIVADKLCHASILDGIQLSRAKHLRYPHQDLSRLKYLLADNSEEQKCVVTESVFSMEGALSPIDKIAALAKEYNANIIVDDAHGIGVLGKHGGGVSEHFGLEQEELPLLVLPLGKAFGSMGAIVAGRDILIEGIIQFARSYRYSTASPPAIPAALQTTLAIVKQQSWRREKLSEICDYFVTAAQERNLPLITNDPLPIKPILIGDNQQCLALQSYLLKHGFYVSCIRPPTVMQNQSRVRISLNCFHEQQDIDKLLDHIRIFMKEVM